MRASLPYLRCVPPEASHQGDWNIAGQGRWCVAEEHYACEGAHITCAWRLYHGASQSCSLLIISSCMQLMDTRKSDTNLSVGEEFLSIMNTYGQTHGKELAHPFDGGSIPPGTIFATAPIVNGGFPGSGSHQTNSSDSKKRDLDSQVQTPMTLSLSMILRFTKWRAHLLTKLNAMNGRSWLCWSKAGSLGAIVSSSLPRVI